VSALPAPEQRVQLTVPVPIGEAFRMAAEYETAKRFDDAERMLGHILKVAPNAPDPLHLMGVVAYRKGRVDEALELMERSLKHGLDAPLHFRNICEVYRAVGRYDEALATGLRAVELNPADAASLVNLAIIHDDRREFDQAIRRSEEALRLDPNLPAAHFELATSCLALGQFERGWEEYEWRFKIAGAPPLLPQTDRPQWDGTPLGDQPLLLIGDQGYGDVIQFARYIDWARERCPNIVIAASKEMQPILKQWDVPRLVDRWEQVQFIEAYCALSGLPRLAKTRLETIPADIPYLHADPALSRQWGERLAALAPASFRKVGIVWAGRPTHKNDRKRSMTLETFGPLAKIPGIALVSLQKGPSASQISRYFGRAPLLNMGPDVNDFGDTMAIIDHLDLVITVDTSVAHLAAAMGKPVWIMIACTNDWRWLLERTDSPWYPTVRLFRQTKPNEWDDVIQNVTTALRQRLG
jgi:tetratricopeptide (TPR) repeat protein